MSDSGPARFGPASASFRLLCLCLEPGADAAAGERLRRVLSAGVDWVALAAIGNAHLMVPALYRALGGKGLLTDVPDDFRDYLAAIYEANAGRMRAIRGQAGRALAALNAAGIAPVVLKGGAQLFEAEPGEAEARMMADLDLLVDEAHFAAALAALGRLDYRPVPVPEGRRFHATTLIHGGEPVCIDLHRDIGPQHDLLPLREALREVIALSTGQCRLHILSPTHRIMHGFFHSQIQNRGHLAGALPLRHLQDFALIAGRHRAAIDWTAIGEACARLRLSGAWEAFVHLAKRCLGAEPALAAGSSHAARRHYRRCLFQLDHPRLRAVLHLAMAASEPLSYANIDYKYRCRGSRARLLRARASELARLLGKYRHRVPRRIAAALRDASGSEVL